MNSKTKCSRVEKIIVNAPAPSTSSSSEIIPQPSLSIRLEFVQSSSCIRLGLLTIWTKKKRDATCCNTGNGIQLVAFKVCSRCWLQRRLDSQKPSAVRLRTGRASARSVDAGRGRVARRRSCALQMALRRWTQIELRSERTCSLLGVASARWVRVAYRQMHEVRNEAELSIQRSFFEQWRQWKYLRYWQRQRLLCLGRRNVLMSQ